MQIIQTQKQLKLNALSITCGDKLNVMDLGGQKAIREYWNYYYDKVDALIYVVDASDDARIAECNESFQALLKDEKLLKVPVLTYGNKVHLPTCLFT